MTSPIFIVGAHKSGTSLLRALFDGHPELFVIPFEAHFFENLGYWQRNPIRRWREVSGLHPEQFIEASYSRVKKANRRPVSTGGSANTKGRFDEDIFYNEIRKGVLSSKSPKGWIKSYVDAIRKSIKSDGISEDDRVLEKSVENFEFVGDLVDMFPNSQFIHIVRSPYANLVSLRKFLPYNRLDRMVGTLRDSLYYLEKNKRITEHYHTVKYESLVKKTKKEMKELSSKVCVEFKKLLLKPTSIGVNWGGNSTEEKSFDGVSDERLGKWRKNISPIEIHLINRVLGDRIEGLGYSVEKCESSYLWPMLQEEISDYIVNRYCYKYGIF